MRIQRFTGGPFAENGYLLTCAATGVCVVVDPGGGTPELLTELASIDRRPEAILLTHAHLDHLDGIPALRERWPDLPVRLHPEDRPLYESAPAQAAAFGLSLPDPLPAPRYDLREGEVLRYGEEIELELRFAPGHAPGHLIFLHRATGQALVGDVVFRGSIGRTDLPGGSHEELLRSIRREVLTLPDATGLLPGHGPETRVGVERHSNPFLHGVEPGPSSSPGEGG